MWLLVEFFVVKDHMRDGGPFPRQLTSKYAEGVARCMQCWRRMFHPTYNNDDVWMTSQHIGPTCKPAGTGSRAWAWDQMQCGLACVVHWCVIFTTNIVHAWPTGEWLIRSHLQACWYWKQALSLGPDAAWLSLCGVPTRSHLPSAVLIINSALRRE